MSVFAFTRMALLTGVITLPLAAVARAEDPPAPPPAPPPDPLARLGQEVSGMFNVDTEPSLLLSEEDNGVFSSRTLHVGEEYADGWRLESIRTNAVTLRKGDFFRTVIVRGRPPPPPEPGAPPSPVTVFIPPLPNIPAKPKATSTAARKIGPAAHTLNELNAMVADRRKAGDFSASTQTLLVADLRPALAALGPGADVNRIPDKVSLQVTGAIWLGDGGYVPSALSVATNGTFNNIVNTAPTGGSPIYGSVTSYHVDGDKVTINKALQINGQVYTITALTLRSGQTAVVELPDGTLYQVTPTLQKR